MQTIFSILGGIGPDPEDLLHMRRTADRLLGKDYLWTILGAGRHQMNLITMGTIMGGNVRTGMEDNIYLGKGAGSHRTLILVPRWCASCASFPWNRPPRTRRGQMLGAQGAGRSCRVLSGLMTSF